MAGYLDDPSATQEVLVGRLAGTGDLGKLDEEGHLTLVGRKEDLISTPAARTSPTSWRSGTERPAESRSSRSSVCRTARDRRASLASACRQAARNRAGWKSTSPGVGQLPSGSG